MILPTEPRTPNPEPSSKWITNWPLGAKWGQCSAAMAAQIAAEGRFAVRLVDQTLPMSRFILQTPRWAQSFAQRHYAVALARKLSPLDRFREQRAAA